MHHIFLIMCPICVLKGSGVRTILRLTSEIVRVITMGFIILSGIQSVGFFGSECKYYIFYYSESILKESIFYFHIVSNLEYPTIFNLF